MDFRQFRTFITAADEEHFGRAAERLDVAQPAVTQQIKILEAELGFKLFHRVGRGVALTEAGRTFSEHARVALKAAEGAVLAGRRASRGETGKISIAYVHSAMLEPELPALLKKFAEQRPNVTITLRDISVQEQVEALADESVDLAFLRAPCGVLSSGIRLTPFSHTPLEMVVPADHECANATTVALRDLAADQFIVVNDPPGVGLGHRTHELCLEAGITLTSVLHTSDAISIVRLVSAGLGVGIVPSTLRRYGIDGAVFKPLPMANCYSEMVIATRAYDQSAVVRSMLELARLQTNRLAAVGIQKNVIIREALN